jgi:serine/threonine protein kinase/tetratricopeptide (TPR) repeat protein
MADAKLLFLDALDRPVEERRAHVEAAAAGDAALRERVLRLLDAHERAEREAAEPAHAAVEDRPGDEIGPYKLLQQIGTGGFGTVYMAEQAEPIRRKVALKVLKLGMDTKQVIARFEAERQALAMMDHPNIAKVLDAGATATGRPYFVMELVKGVPITDYCDQSNLTTEERLELFQQVCHAVQHAHQKGIIHRDLKPSNLLVTLHDGRPVPKVIDFGIAKATDHRLTERTLFTEFRQIVGTPEYMSPEQAELSGLDVDIRADVYSLGVLLYELLTGTKPFEMKDLMEKGFGEILRVIREVDPPRPSTRLSTMGAAATGVAKRRRTEPRQLGRLVHGDLDWIVMRALEKDRTRRYETASAFAADLGRFLTDQPVEARPPSTPYRARKFVKRHRTSVAATAAVFVALAVGLAVAAGGWREAHAREREARVEAKRANTVLLLVNGMLSSADPHNAMGANFTVRELLDEFDRTFGEQLAAEPEVESSVRALVGNAYRHLGLPDKAAPHLAAALSIRRRLSSPLLRASRQDWSWLLHDQGRYGEAVAELQRLLAEHRASGGDAAGEIGLLTALADNLEHLQRRDEAERAANDALARADPGTLEAAESLNAVGGVARKRGDLSGAEGRFREALSIYEALAPRSSRIGVMLNNLSVVLKDQGRYKEAEAVSRRAVERCLELSGREEQPRTPPGEPCRWPGRASGTATRSSAIVRGRWATSCPTWAALRRPRPSTARRWRSRASPSGETTRTWRSRWTFASSATSTARSWSIETTSPACCESRADTPRRSSSPARRWIRLGA